MFLGLCIKNQILISDAEGDPASLNRRSGGVNQSTITALVNVIFCMEEISRGNDNFKKCVDWTKSLFLGGANVIPEKATILSQMSVMKFCKKLREADFGLNEHFLEIVAREVLIEYLPKLVKIANIPCAGSCIDFVLLPVLGLVLFKSTQIRPIVATSEIYSTAVIQCIVSRFTMSTGIFIMSLFEDLLRFDANLDVVTQVLSLAEPIHSAIKAVDWTLVAPVAFSTVAPIYKVCNAAQAYSISFDPVRRRIENAALVEVDIEWLNGQVVKVPAKKRNREHREIKGSVEVPSMGDYLRTAIVLYSESDRNPILSYISGE